MRKIFLGSLAVIILLAQVVLVHRFFTSRNNMVFDFVLRWYGAQAMIFGGVDPYSEAVTNETQMGLLGKPADPNQCELGFLYPAFLALAVPHFLLPADLALSAWVVTQEVLLAAVIWLLVGHVTSENDGLYLKFPRLLVLSLAGVTYYYSLQNLGYAQFSIYVLFWFVLAWWLWEKERYVLAGVALALTATKPQLAFLVLPIWVLFAALHRRWSFVTASSGTLVALVISPFLFTENWLSGFYSMAMRAASTCQDPVYQKSSLGLRLAFSALILVALTTAWIKGRKTRESLGTAFLLCLGLDLTLLTSPFVHGYDLVLTLVPLLYGLTVLTRAQGWPAAMLESMYWGTLLIFPWLIRLLAPNHAENSVQLWLMPLLVLALTVAVTAVQKGQIEQASESPSSSTTGQ